MVWIIGSVHGKVAGIGHGHIVIVGHDDVIHQAHRDAGQGIEQPVGGVQVLFRGQSHSIGMVVGQYHMGGIEAQSDFHHRAGADGGAV